MDPELVALRMQQSRTRLRELLLAGQPGHEDADVFPRSKTMKFLLDPQRRGIATTALGTLASMAFARRRRKADKEGPRRGLASAMLGLIGGLRK